MKKILKLLYYYVSYTRFIGWLSGVGALLLGLSLIGLFLQFNNTAALVLASIGVTLLYGIPAFVLFVPFRELISNERLTLVPNFKLQAGIALLIFTLFGSIYLPVLIALFEPQGKAAKLAFCIYFLSCLYQYFVQKALASRHFLFFITLGPVLIIAPLVALRDAIAPILFQPQVMISLVLLTIPAWFIFFIKLKRVVKFTPINTDYPGSNHGAADPFQVAWPKRQHFIDCFSYTGTLLGGQPDGKMATLIRSAFLVYVIPLAGVIILGFVDFFNTHELTKTNLVNVYLTLSTLFIGFTPVFYSEFAPRSRMLWLRHGSNRHSHWQHLESVMWRSQIYIIALVLLNTLILQAVPFVDRNFIVHYPLFIAILVLFNMYFGLYSRIKNWPQVARVLFTMIANILFLSFTIHILKNGNTFASLYIVMALFSLLAFIFRIQAMSSFSTIDWMQIQLLKTKRYS